VSGEVVEGVVVEKSSRHVRVATEVGLLLCDVRGRFRGSEGGRLPLVVGDRVKLRTTQVGEGVIEERLPRRTELRRSRSGGGREPAAWESGGRQRSRWGEELVVASNVDQVLAVFAAREPAPRWGLLDRILVSAQLEGLGAALCVNKWDQLDGNPDARDSLEADLSVYVGLGCPVFRTSALHGTGLEGLSDWLKGKTSVLSGHSGVGKSTLLLRLCPGAEVVIGELSEATGRGRHVTTRATLYGLPQGGQVIDTPGFREYGLLRLGAAELGRLFSEFLPHVANCRYKDCLHVSEPDCAVRRALENGAISHLRYTNYVQILHSLDGVPGAGG
jgi:ribosome biogenesis GTPase